MTTLIIDDNKNDRTRYNQWLSGCGKFAEPVFAANLEEAHHALNLDGRAITCAIVLWELQGPNSGAEVIGSLSERFGYDLPVIAVTGSLNSAMAAYASQLGAADVLTKPLARDEVIDAVEGVLRRWSNIDAVDGTDFGIVGKSRKLRDCLHRLLMIAESDGNVLLVGETGTGKERFAKAIHNYGPRKDCRFEALNVAALPPTLIESELFGHSKGAFTGATHDKSGCFERCETGTLFLDEIGELEIGLQSKLLRVLQERQFERVGDAKVLKFQGRLVCATHRDLFDDVNTNRFREDLYYRLDVHTIHVPPLREREDDWRLLAEHFLRNDNGAASHSLSRDTEQLLKDYKFPGNVRELESIISGAKAICPRGPIRPCHLPLEQMARRLDALRGRVTTESMHFSERLFTVTHREALAELEQLFDRAYLPRKLREANNVVTEAAAAAGCDADTFEAHWKKHIGPWKDRPK